MFARTWITPISLTIVTFTYRKLCRCRRVIMIIKKGRYLSLCLEISQRKIGNIIYILTPIIMYKQWLEDRYVYTVKSIFTIFSNTRTWKHQQNHLNFKIRMNLLFAKLNFLWGKNICLWAKFSYLLYPTSDYTAYHPLP